eukprot:INCI744.4.p1 GENE.INCI744.4~~INCI744.4.p1  ORF type:complete len:589 (-),score=124.26 INCI744.4:533-2299(-)
MDSPQVQEILKAKPHLRAVQTPEAATFRDGFAQKFESALREFDELSAAPNDPATPYDTKYQARKIFEDLLGELLIGRIGVVQEAKAPAPAAAGGGGGGGTAAAAAAAKAKTFVEELGAMQAKIEMRLGENYYDTEEISRGYDYLLRALEWYCPKSAVGEKLFDPAQTFLDEEMPRMRKHVADVLHCLNLVGAVKSGRGDPQQALVVLRKADDFYHDFVAHAHRPEDLDSRSCDDNVGTGDIKSLISSLDVPVVAATKVDGATSSSSSPSSCGFSYEVTVQTLEAAAERNLFTVFFLAQVCGAVGDTKGSAQNCKRCLDKQYEGRVQFSWREWCPTAINIVDYCMGTGQSLLPVAHAWLWVIRRVQLAEEAKESADSEDADELARQSEKLTADWHRRMALVKLNAFRAKRSEMIGHPEEPDPVEAADTGLFPRELVKLVTAEQAAQPDFKPLQPFVGAEGLQTKEQAWDYAKDIIQHLASAQKFYVLDGYVTEYTEIQMEKSQTYSFLCEWETEKNQLSLHRRRIQLLEPLAEQLKASAFEDFVRQIEFELGECLTTAIDLKERKIVAKQKETRGAYKPTPAEIQQYRD